MGNALSSIWKVKYWSEALEQSCVQVCYADLGVLVLLITLLLGCHCCFSVCTSWYLGVGKSAYIVIVRI